MEDREQDGCAALLHIYYIYIYIYIYICVYVKLQKCVVLHNSQFIRSFSFISSYIFRFVYRLFLEWFVCTIVSALKVTRSRYYK